MVRFNKKMIRIFDYTMLTVILISLTDSCNTKQNISREQMVNDYYYGLNTGDFNLISNCISDSIITAEMDYILTQNKQDLYKQFQWDSVFKPNYSLIDLTNDSSGILVTVAKICKRIEFLQDTALVYKAKIDFSGNKIIKISITDYVYMNLKKWGPTRDSLSAWIDKYHPELAGFVNDMTLNGAQNYLTAIDLYENEK
jgi:hypothetical protein